MGLNEYTIVNASEGIRTKKFSCEELVADCIHAIETHESELHAYLDVYKDARMEAKKLDEMRQATTTLPSLFGIPLAVKDNIMIDQRRCTAGSKMLEHYVSSYDATVIKKLKHQGAMFLGKTNMDEFAMGSSTEYSAFGPTHNPHDVARVPGGSSGGSAVAVAADMCIAALGSDTGGSIRQPASFCGVVGMKPTYGCVSRHGLIAMASSLDQIGPMAKTVADAKLLFEAISGVDNFDATLVPMREYPPRKEKKMNELVVGVPKEYFGKGLDMRIEKMIGGIITQLEKEGITIREIRLSHADVALSTYYIVVPAEVSANLARFDGIRYGFSESGTSDISLTEHYAKTRAEGFGVEVKRRIMLGTYTLSAGYYDAYYVQAQKVRRIIREDFVKAFEDVDVIVGPTTPTVAFPAGDRAADPLQMYLADKYTIAVNLAGLPALSLPVGVVEEDGSKLPVGMQLIAKWFCEDILFDLGSMIEKIVTY